MTHGEHQIIVSAVFVLFGVVGYCTVESKWLRALMAVNVVFHSLIILKLK